MAAKREVHLPLWIGFDLGGTKMLSVLYDSQFKTLARKRKKTRAETGAKEGLRRITALVQETLDEAGVSHDMLGGIGIGCPGPLDLDAGIVHEMPNLGWKRVRLKAALEAAFGCGVLVLNDVDAGIYGEYRFGAAKGARCVVGVFPGTGIGGGAVYEGAILRGARGSCMEIGHLPVVRDGPLCGCGRRGCLEAVAGRLAVSAQVAMAAARGEAPNLMRTAGTDLREIRSRALADAIAAGDTVVETIVREAARTVGWATAGLINVLAPDTVVLGGGMVEDMPELWQTEVGAAAVARVMPSFAGTFKVVVAKLEGDAAVAGAAAWAQHMIERPRA